MPLLVAHSVDWWRLLVCCTEMIRASGRNNVQQESLQHEEHTMRRLLICRVRGRVGSCVQGKNIMIAQEPHTWHYGYFNMKPDLAYPNPVLDKV